MQVDRELEERREKPLSTAERGQSEQPKLREQEVQFEPQSRHS